MTLKFLDRILEQLQDDQWHSLDEIKESTSLSPDALNKLLLFLQEGKFIDRKDDKLKITPLGLKLFKLQPEPPVTKFSTFSTFTIFFIYIYLSSSLAAKRYV